jgi:hypothetical protein
VRHPATPHSRRSCSLDDRHSLISAALHRRLSASPGDGHSGTPVPGSSSDLSEISLVLF